MALQEQPVEDKPVNQLLSLGTEIEVLQKRLGEANGRIVYLEECIAKVYGEVFDKQPMMPSR